LEAGGDNDEISDADVRTSSAFKIEMALVFLGVGGEVRIVQIVSPALLLYFPIYHFSLFSIFLRAF
jgi:hypothetical protein